VAVVRAEGTSGGALTCDDAGGCGFDWCQNAVTTRCVLSMVSSSPAVVITSSSRPMVASRCVRRCVDVD